MALYHLHASTGSRSGGQSAQAKDEYIEREGSYAYRRKDIQVCVSGNMPEWACDNPSEYWKAADIYERANGRLYVEIEFSFPVEIPKYKRLELALEFADAVPGKEVLPYTLAIHKNDPNNPHCHLMISERSNDGVLRSPDSWFRKADAKTNGGAKKTKALQSLDWFSEVRELWANIANAALEREGCGERIDHRTLKAQGIDRIPQIHVGTYASNLEHSERKAFNEAIKRANVERVEIKEELASIESELSRLEMEISAALAEEKAEEENRVNIEGSENAREVSNISVNGGTPAAPNGGTERKEIDAPASNESTPRDTRANDTENKAGRPPKETDDITAMTADDARAVLEKEQRRQEALHLEQWEAYRRAGEEWSTHIEREPEKPLLPWKRMEYERHRLQWSNEKEEKWAAYLAAVKTSGADPRGGGTEDIQRAENIIEARHGRYKDEAARRAREIWPDAVKAIERHEARKKEDEKRAIEEWGAHINEAQRLTDKKGFLICATEGQEYWGVLCGVYERGGKFYAVQELDGLLVRHDITREDLPKLERMRGRDVKIKSGHEHGVTIRDANSRGERSRGFGR